ncbi:hypothetical protein JOB18_027405 [Solea senegalensis]|uniref:C-type lectin domain-containing protein n=2 Tax=Solea senegalensis TaxID=28829 RepID=A0AAV6PUB0_SOLSE|nr:hypothetical protein JOB18_049075 [Solea senegalensis]KAG7475224.1 hypothetical protein JOB18_027405 [Solea senegalensis]
MFPVLLLFLLSPTATLTVMAQDSDFSTDQQKNNIGTKFIVAFPENIAYYHPILPFNSIEVTTLYDQTKVQIKTHNQLFWLETLTAGETRNVFIDVSLELKKTNMSNEAVVVLSNKDIVVNAITLKDNSVQTALVIPTDKLSTRYLIPPLPNITGATVDTSLAVTERRPFKLVIISGDRPTTVSVVGQNPQEFSLQPQQVAQILVKKEDKLKEVHTDHPVAVLLSHACVLRSSCTCGLLQSTLLPAKNHTLRFFIPPALASRTSNTLILVSSSLLVDYDPTSPVLETSGAAILYRPGLLLNLIPETDFASCFVVNGISLMENSIVIVIHKDFTDGVRIGDAPLQSPGWQKLQGTNYMSTEVVVEPGKHVVWHTYANMAVYFLGSKSDVPYGNPAAAISTSPDFRGCVVIPEVLLIGDVAAGWRESVKFCRDRDLELVSLSSSENITHIYSEIEKAKNGSEEDVWIGLRRSSHNGEWYWLNGEDVGGVNWDDGEPGTMNDGQCAIMSLKSGKDFGWRDDDCCMAARPVCYRRPLLFPL